MSQPTPLSDDFIGQRQRRIQHLEELKKLGIETYPAQSKKDYVNSAVREQYEALKGKRITVAGRLMKWRVMGKIIFADIVDQSGKLQICIRRNELQSQPPAGLDWKALNLIDLGDFIQVTGRVDQSQAGEVSVFAQDIVFLSKALRPLPNTLDDKEAKFRRRYLDMVLHPEVRDVFTRKAAFWQSFRNNMVRRGFTEIFVPVLEHTTGGADARPFITHHNDLDSDFYLRISVELFCKRAIGAGYDRVFTIGPVFRNEGMSDEHANEYNHFESYQAYGDYHDQMDLTRDLITQAAIDVYGKTTFSTRGHSFDLASEWTQIDYTTVLKEKFDIDIFTTPESEMKKILDVHGVQLEGGSVNRARLIDNLWKIIRKTISGPAFLINEPAFMSPLSKARRDDPRLTERFHVVIAGTELANGYSEINDPQYQLEQFRAQEAMRDSGDDEAQMLDIDFVEMLEYGIPPTAGNGLSERVFWFFENLTAREGTMFPLLRAETDPLSKKVYPFVKDASPTHTVGKARYTEMDQDFTKRVVIVVDSTLEPWQITNTVGHISAYMGNQLGVSFGTGTYFITQDGLKLPRNSQYPIVILSADKSDLPPLLEKTRSSGLLFHAFIREMIETNNDREITTELAHRTADSMNYLGIGIFGDNDMVAKLTKKFPLYKGTTTSSLETKHTSMSAPVSKLAAHSLQLSLTRDQAWELVTTHIKNPGLQKHSLAVEAAMRALARHFGQDEELWGIVGLLHDIDWEECRDNPAEHTLKTIEWLRAMGVHHNELISAILTHAHHVTSYRQPESQLEWSLFCCDELTGLIVATTLILSSKKIADTTVESVIKKMGSKSFAAAIDREGIKLCEPKLGIPLPEFVKIVLAGMQAKASELGLSGV